MAGSNYTKNSNTEFSLKNFNLSKYFFSGVINVWNEKEKTIYTCTNCAKDMKTYLQNLNEIEKNNIIIIFDGERYKLSDKNKLKKNNLIENIILLYKKCSREQSKKGTKKRKKERKYKNDALHI
jgi:hypothetical protein